VGSSRGRIDDREDTEGSIVVVTDIATVKMQDEIVSSGVSTPCNQRVSSLAWRSRCHFCDLHQRVPATWPLGREYTNAKRESSKSNSFNLNLFSSIVVLKINASR